VLNVQTELFHYSILWFLEEQEGQVNKPPWNPSAMEQINSGDLKTLIQYFCIKHFKLKDNNNSNYDKSAASFCQ
jgi:4-alpha-glucanotransferase